MPHILWNIKKDFSVTFNMPSTYIIPNLLYFCESAGCLHSTRLYRATAPGTMMMIMMSITSYFFVAVDQLPK